MTDSEYRAALIEELTCSLSAHYDDNYDAMNLGPEPAPTETPEAAPQELLDEDPNLYFEQRFGERLNVGEDLFNCLADQSSRDLLVKIMAYRLLGYRHVKLPRNTPEYWEGIERAVSLKTDAPLLPINWQGLSLAQYDTTELGFDMKVYAGGTGIACYLIQKQYEYISPEVTIKPEAGDVIIDAGACWGETSLYFAHEAGPSGSVYAYEFIPSNLSVAKKNLSNNPDLARNVTIVEHPVWRNSG